MIEPTQMSQNVTSCSLEACLNQRLKRAMFSSSCGKLSRLLPGAAYSLPVMGETIRGM